MSPDEPKPRRKRYSPDEIRSLEEIRKIYELLTDAEKTRMVMIARIRAKGTSYEHRDLINEAWTRVFEGRRKWPKDVDVIPFMSGVMWSVSGDWQAEKHDESVDIDSVGIDNHPRAATLDAQKIMALFDDDPIAQKMVIAMMKGLRGEELKEMSGLTQTEYESKRTKIRRRVEKIVY